MSGGTLEAFGGCYCGAVRYALSSHRGTGICYCRNCRKAVGVHAVAWVETSREAVTILHGFPARFNAPNGAVWSFCSQCGSTLFWEPAERSGDLAVTTGTLDEPGAFAPEQLSWVADCLPWDRPLPLGLQQSSATRRRAAGNAR